MATRSLRAFLYYTFSLLAVIGLSVGVRAQFAPPDPITIDPKPASPSVSE